MALHIVTFRKEGVDWNCNSRILLACYQVTFRKEGVDWNFIMNLVLTASGVTFRKEGVDWNSKRHTLTSQEQNVTFRKEGVDWNKIFSILKIDRMVTFRKEGVDWNIWKSNITRAFGVTFRKEGVDWNNYSDIRIYRRSKSPSARKVWIEILLQSCLLLPGSVTFCKEGVDWNSASRIALALLFWVTFRKEGVDWNFCAMMSPANSPGHLPQGRCGLKLETLISLVQGGESPSARKVWIEIQMTCTASITVTVTFRKEGVDWQGKWVFWVLHHIL